MNTYWVDSDCDGMFLLCEDAAGNIGKSRIDPLDDPDWSFSRAWPVAYILECATEAEDDL